jgi:hypothetical protein
MERGIRREEGRFESHLVQTEVEADTRSLFIPPLSPTPAWPVVDTTAVSMDDTRACAPPRLVSGRTRGDFATLFDALV